jgi:hypothetical protein
MVNYFQIIMYSYNIRLVFACVGLMSVSVKILMYQQKPGSIVVTANKLIFPMSIITIHEHHHHHYHLMICPIWIMLR